jgi:hypothetical protein
VFSWATGGKIRPTIRACMTMRLCDLSMAGIVRVLFRVACRFI